MIVWWRSRATWLMPGALALLVSSLGIAINLATSVGSSWVSWLVVGLLSFGIAAGTASSERQRVQRQRERERTGTVAASSAGDSSALLVSGLVMRHTQTAAPDGSITTVREYFSEELALQSLREDSLDESTR
jgi:uncharacterized membrane protein